MLWCGCSVEAPTNMGRESLTPEGVSHECGLRGAWWRGGDGGRRQRSVRRWRRLLGWGWSCGRGGLWSRSPTGLKTGHYRGSLIRGRFGFGGGREAVVAVAVDGVADGLAPGVGAESVDVFVLGDVDGLRESLHQVGDGVGGFGFYIAAHNGGDEACQGGAEIT